MADPSSNQISPLRPLTTYITGHNAEKQAIVHSKVPANWKPHVENSMAFNVAYTTSEFPADLNNDADIKKHQALVESGKLGLVNPNGTVCRIVDFRPDAPSLMHRTISLDYGIVLEGEVDMELTSGEVVRMKRGDVAVQRATYHAWKNPSKTEWARIAFVLTDCKPLDLDGEAVGEDLGAAKDINASGN